MRRNIFLRVLADSAISIVAMVVFGAGLGAAYSFLQSDAYDARSRVMVVADPAAGRFDLLPATWVASARIRDYTAMIDSQNLLNRAIDLHKLNTSAPLLAKSLKVTSPSQTQLLDITVTMRDPVLAANASRAVAEEFALALRELETGVVIHASIVELAEVAQRARDPQVVVNVINTSMAMGVLTLVLILARALTDPKLRWLPGLQVIAGAPVIGSVPGSDSVRRFAMRSKHRSKVPVASNLTLPSRPNAVDGADRVAEDIEVYIPGQPFNASILRAIERDLGDAVTVIWSGAVAEGTGTEEHDNEVPALVTAQRAILVLDDDIRWSAATREIGRLAEEVEGPVMVAILKRTSSASGRRDVATEMPPDDHQVTEARAATAEAQALR